MGTYTPNTSLLVQHVAGRLATILTPAWRTNIGANVTTEREQEIATAAPFCNVRLASWEADEEGTAVVRRCELVIEATVPATDQDAEAQARLAAEDVFELFRFPAAGASLAAGVQAVLRPVDSAVLDRPEGAPAVIARLTLRADLYESL